MRLSKLGRKPVTAALVVLMQHNLLWWTGTQQVKTDRPQPREAYEINIKAVMDLVRVGRVSETARSLFGDEVRTYLRQVRSDERGPRFGPTRSRRPSDRTYPLRPLRRLILTCCLAVPASSCSRASARSLRSSPNSPPETSARTSATETTPLRRRHPTRRTRRGRASARTTCRTRTTKTSPLDRSSSTQRVSHARRQPCCRRSTV
jgi:hypothetical protein